MKYLNTFVFTLVLVPFTVLALYKAISAPGSHKLDRLGESRKLNKSTIKKVVAINIVFIFVLNIIGFLI